MKIFWVGLAWTMVVGSNVHASINACARGEVIGDIGPTVTQDPVSGKYSISYTRPSGGDDTWLYIRCSANEQIENVIVSNPSNRMLRVYIVGWNGSTSPCDSTTEDFSKRPASVDNIITTNNTGMVIITRLHTVGDVGNVEATRLFNADIGGDVTGDIVLTPNTGTSPQSGYMQDCEVAGDLLGDVVIVTEPTHAQVGTMERVIIGGEVGTSALDTYMAVDGLIREVQVGSLKAHVTSTVLGAVGQIDELSTVTSTGKDGKLHGEILVENVDQVSGDPSTLSFAGGIASI